MHRFEMHDKVEFGIRLKIRQMGYVFRLFFSCVVVVVAAAAVQVVVVQVIVVQSVGTGSWDPV